MKKLLIIGLAGLSAGYINADITGLLKEAGQLADKAKEMPTGELVSKAKDIGVKVGKLVGPVKTYRADTNISFEIKNKDNQELNFSVESDGKVLTEAGEISPDEYGLFKIDAGETAQLPVDITKKTTVLIWNPRTEKYEIYGLATNKTMYLTWDGTVLRPQTGPGKGLLGRTDTGLSIKNNVAHKDVVKVHEVEPSQEAEGASAAA